jgi:hypothetical protein
LSAPTLAELRARVFKHSPPPDRPDAPPSPEVGSWLARRVGRPSAIYGTWLAIRLGLTANQVTAFALLASLAGAATMATGTRAGFIAGVLLAHAAFWLDHVDGQVARWRRTARLGGIYFDFMMHHAANLALGFGLGFGLAIRTGSPGWSAAGMLVGAGWLFLGLHNDCLYKAIFARLDQERGAVLVRLQHGPSRSARRPSRWLGRVSWLLQKSCESPVILLTLTGIGLAAVASETIWGAAWVAYVSAMAALAPGLAVARAARCVVLDTPAVEYDRRFGADVPPAA